MAAEFVRARHAGLDVETVLPVTSLPYLAGWEQVVDEPGEPAADETSAEPPPAPPAGPPTSRKVGSTSVGRLSTSQEP